MRMIAFRTIREFFEKPEYSDSESSLRSWYHDAKKADMAKYHGSQNRVSEILNRKRKLTLKMVKSLYNGLKIPAEILLV